MPATDTMGSSSVKSGGGGSSVKKPLVGRIKIKPALHKDGGPSPKKEQRRPKREVTRNLKRGNSLRSITSNSTRRSSMSSQFSIFSAHSEASERSYKQLDVNVVSLSFDRLQAVYHGGDTVKGQVSLDNITAKTIHCEVKVHFQGEIHSEFVQAMGTSASSTQYTFTGKNTLQHTLDHVRDGPECPTIAINPGKLTIPLQFVLRDTAPGSVQDLGTFHNNYKGHIDYKIRVHLYVPSPNNSNKMQHQCMEKTVRVLPSVVVASRTSPLLQPTPLREQKEASLSTGGSCTILPAFLQRNNPKHKQDSHKVSLGLQLDRRAYSPGQAVDFQHSYAHNHTKETLQVYCGIRLHTQLQGTSSNQVLGIVTNTKTCDTALLHDTIAPGECWKLTDKLDRDASMLPLTMTPSSCSNASSSRSKDRPYVLKWTYSMILWVGNPDDATTKLVEVEQPIVLCSEAPPIPEMLPRSQSARSASIRSSFSVNNKSMEEELNDKWAILNHVERRTYNEASERNECFSGQLPEYASSAGSDPVLQFDIDATSHHEDGDDGSSISSSSSSLGFLGVDDEEDEDEGNRIKENPDNHERLRFM